MTEYWKSQAKKYCDFCKVWITDNKASVNFHEQGKTHQNNVSKKLDELRKKGQVEQTRKYEMDIELKKMESAALKSYHQDLTNNPDFTAYAVTQKYPQAVRNLPAGAGNSKSRGSQSAAEAAALAAASSIGAGPGPSMPLLPPPKVWHETKTPEGYSYYWNVDTQETRWDPPEEGYVSILEQQLEELKNSVENGETGEYSGAPTVAKKKKKKKQKYDFSQPLAHNDYDEEPQETTEPEPVVKPYGDWQTVEKPPEPAKVNLQLPKIQFLKPKAPVISEEPKITFKQKTTSISFVPVAKREPDEVAFKKRKLGDDVKKNSRQRDTE